MSHKTNPEYEPFSDTYGYDYRADTERPYVTVYDAADNTRTVAEHVRYADAWARYGDESWPTPDTDESWPEDDKS